MKFLHKIAVILLFPLCSFGQTVYITGDVTPDEDKEKYTGKYIFSQFALSMPFRANPDSGEVMDEETGETESWFLPDGISAYGSFGVHYKYWVGIAVNAGLEGRIQPKLVSVPVYASVLFNPQFNGESGLLIEYGYGRAFALGRGDLSGAYSKFKIGFIADNEYYFYIDFSRTDIQIYEFNFLRSVSLGISIFDFL